jgi:hypothetical protein
MNGQKTPYDEEQEAVDRYVEGIGLYEEKEPLRFNIKAYARYMMEHNLNNPDDVPPEIMESFWRKKASQTA